MPLGRLRLLVALDALLVEQSVGRAAERMGVGAPAMSRLLKQIREIYGDPILRKTGRGMAPTPFAENLRLRIRALAEEAADLLQAERTGIVRSSNATNRLPLSAAPALSLTPVIDIGGPTPRQFAAKLDAIGLRATPQQRLAKAIATIGTGTGRSRPLSLEEAEEAFDHILAGHADPIQVGAFLAILQYRDATAPELAGIARALRRHIGAISGPASPYLDWPAYLSPKAPLQPWFLMAARLLRDQGTPVLIHGGTGVVAVGERLDRAVEFLGIPIADDLDAASSMLSVHGAAYLPLLRLSDQLTALIALYRLFEMRSPINQAIHLTNPLNAQTIMLGAFHSSYKDLPREAAALLGWENVAVTSFRRDAAEMVPRRSNRVLRSMDGVPSDMLIPAAKIEAAARPVEISSFEYWKAIWSGKARDEEPVRKVVDTVALALMAIRKAPATDWSSLQAEAGCLWNQRQAKGAI